MADYTESKGPWGAAYPQGALEQDWIRTEPLISAQQVIDRFLVGVPLVSGVPDPITRKLVRITPELIQEKIYDAIADLEEEVGFYIMPLQVRERHPFDLNEFRSFGYFKLRNRPVASIEKLQMESAGQTVFFEIPKDWIDTGYLLWGQINILPLSPGTYGNPTVMTGGPAAMVFLTALTQNTSIPSYWTAEYTVGFPDGQIPRAVNNLIGIETAMEVLSLLGASYHRNSTSLGIDSLSQSIGTPGPNLYDTRRNALAEKKQVKIKKLKKMLGTKILTGSI